MTASPSDGHQAGYWGGFDPEDAVDFTRAWLTDSPGTSRAQQLATCSQAIFMPSTSRSAKGESISDANQSSAGGSPRGRATDAICTTCGRSRGGAWSADSVTGSKT